LNANCYITKPSDLDEYVDVVRSIENFWFLTATLPDSGFHRQSMKMSRACMRGALAEHLRN
jgi:hypothetical protein